MFFHLYITYSSSKKAQNLENGFMKESGTYFISEFNNFFPVFFFFFFFRENSFTNDIFIFILVYILLFCKKESATRCNNINRCNYTVISFQIREETLARRFVNL